MQRIYRGQNYNYQHLLVTCIINDVQLSLLYIEGRFNVTTVRFSLSVECCNSSYSLYIQNESLNGGGKLFVDKHPNLRVRVVHGNTLTAAVILDEIPNDVEEVFLTGATSKLGRAIALYLCRKKVKVLVSLSKSHFIYY